MTNLSRVININNYKKYRGHEEDGKFALLHNHEIVKIHNWTDPNDDGRQEVYFIDKHGKTWWEYADRFAKFGKSKIMLRLYERKRSKAKYKK
jgi:hypothetical protein